MADRDVVRPSGRRTVMDFPIRRNLDQSRIPVTPKIEAPVVKEPTRALTPEESFMRTMNKQDSYFSTFSKAIKNGIKEVADEYGVSLESLHINDEDVVLEAIELSDMYGRREFGSMAEAAGMAKSIGKEMATTKLEILTTAKIRFKELRKIAILVR